MRDGGLRKAVIIGALCGALVSLASAIAMDYVFSGSLQGTWRDAAVKDVTKMFGPAYGQNYFFVSLVLIVVMGFLAAFGALLGVVGGVIVNRFFKLLLK